MAKKILAVVMAVMIALSAMAVTVFADQRIDLYKNKDSKSTTIEVTFDIPVYGLYGYLTAGDYMLLDLPIDWGWNADANEVKWSIQVNGMTFALPTQKGDVKATNDKGEAIEWNNVVGNDPTTQSPVKVTLAYLAHDFDGVDTAIPQSIGYNTINSFRLVASLTVSGEGCGWKVSANDLFSKNDALYRTSMKAQWYKADGTPVAGSVSYVPTWNAQQSDSSNTDPGVYDFVTQEWSNGVKNDESVPLTWDHTLGNRAIIFGAESCELVVELNKPISGRATYTLYANTGDALYPEQYNNLWWNFNNSRKYVNQVSVDGTASELRFNVPVEILYDANPNSYGTYNRQFVIFENITLKNDAVMKNYMSVDRSKVGGAGTLGDISWGESWAGDRVSYKGTAVNYARTGVAGKGVVIGQVPYPDAESTTTVAMNPESTGGAWTATDVVVTPGKTVVAEFKYSDVEPYQAGIYLAWDKPVAVDTDIKNTHKSVFTATYEDLVKFGAKEGDAVVIGLNSWGDNAWTPIEVTVKVYDAKAVADAGKDVYSGENLGADVMAKAIYLNFPEAADENAEPAVDTERPTEGGDNVSDEEGDDVNVNDNEPVEVDNTPVDNAPTADRNPITGVAFAVVPMLVAAAAAVVAKKH